MVFNMDLTSVVAFIRNISEDGSASTSTNSCHYGKDLEIDFLKLVPSFRNARRVMSSWHQLNKSVICFRVHPAMNRTCLSMTLILALSLRRHLEAASDSLLQFQDCECRDTRPIEHHDKSLECVWQRQNRDGL